MRHHLYNKNFKFVVEPENFDKYTDRELLQYCLGAVMYMPGTKKFAPKILSYAMPGLAAMVLCFEDACPENDVPAAEENAYRFLNTIAEAVDNNTLDKNRIPLIFCRIRNMEQFLRFTNKLTKKQVGILAGINFPKFNSENGNEYMEHLKKLNEKFGEIIYGMPIIEDPKVAFKETRIEELIKIKKILDKFHDLILQVRVGATDFSSYFGVRRGVGYSIYDILPVSDCLSDILNIFERNNDYVVSGPVWEYFRVSEGMMFLDLPKYDFEDCLMRRISIVNNEIDGLLREVILDKANGFVGRTVIHPTHIKYVNALQAVTKEEYDDACMILNSKSSGVIKGTGANKMNEITPHTNWAKKIYMRSRAYGVVENANSYIKLFSVND